MFFFSPNRAFLTSKNAAANNAIIIDNFNPVVTSASTSTYGNYENVMNQFNSYINSINSTVALSGVNNPWIKEFLSSGQRYFELLIINRNSFVEIGLFHGCRLNKGEN